MEKNERDRVRRRVSTNTGENCAGKKQADCGSEENTEENMYKNSNKYEEMEEEIRMETRTKKEGNCMEESNKFDPPDLPHQRGRNRNTAKVAVEV